MKMTRAFVVALLVLCGHADATSVFHPQAFARDALRSLKRTHSYQALATSLDRLGCKLGGKNHQLQDFSLSSRGGLVSDSADDSVETLFSNVSPTAQASQNEKLQIPDLELDADNYDDAAEYDKENVWHHMVDQKTGNSALMIVRGSGLRVWDVKGREYLDAVSGGTWTVNVGYGRSEIADAVRDQLVKLNFFHQSAANVPAARFAQRLISKMPGMSRVYYSSSGSEANEKAFKMVRLIAHRKYGGNKWKILFRERDYHGTTITALSATGQEQRRHQFGPFTPGFVEVPHNCEYRSQFGNVEDYGIRSANEIEKTILAEGPETVGAICLESITAGGGAIMPPLGYWRRVQEICREYNVLLLLDEVVMGLGRTGKWFGYQHFDVKPDIVTMAKGLASGYAAISCTVTTNEVFEMCHQKCESDEGVDLGYFRDISTFGACTAGPTAALANMQIIENERLIENSANVGAYLQESLHQLEHKHKIIGQVRGLGLFAGIELVKNRQTKEPVDETELARICADVMSQGVMIGRTNRSFQKLNNTILLAPALVATKADIDAITRAIDVALTRHKLQE